MSKKQQQQTSSTFGFSFMHLKLSMLGEKSPRVTFHTKKSVTKLADINTLFAFTNN
ncbi:hypothetical protein TUM3792_15380 [Shewanella sp. MBTL60-007]|nr:hypothetical protein TUM3792_15380 [Shewanella sp. MBTL60-007]